MYACRVSSSVSLKLLHQFSERDRAFQAQSANPSEVKILSYFRPVASPSCKPSVLMPEHSIETQQHIVVKPPITRPESLNPNPATRVLRPETLIPRL
jgi:hypothetical protein